MHFYWLLQVKVALPFKNQYKIIHVDGCLAPPACPGQRAAALIHQDLAPREGAGRPMSIFYWFLRVELALLCKKQYKIINFEGCLTPPACPGQRAAGAPGG